MNTKSQEITEGIKVTVNPEFVNFEENRAGKKYIFSYRVEIKNIGSEWAKLLSRYWLIINSEGEEEEVNGAGVIGYFPELKPGTSFTYTSYCPLNTAWGTMEGYFNMSRKDGTNFKAKIGRFYLVAPEMID